MSNPIARRSLNDENLAKSTASSHDAKSGVRGNCRANRIREFLYPRVGFTLIEIMVVIVIIGILAGLLLPAVMNAVNTAQQGAYKLEIDTLATAVEKYRNKYGDYPPDGSSWQIMERHLRKAFPQILESELNLLNPTPTAALLAYQGWATHPWLKNSTSGIAAGIRNDFDQSVIMPTYVAADYKVMDPAEALVFFLGGFSSNPQRPFTGDGGPFVVTVGAAGTSPPAVGMSAAQTLQYNVARTNPMFEFKTNRLSLTQVSVGGVPVNISNDEEEFLGSADSNDLLPVYMSRGDLAGSAPIVYFDSRTYVFSKGANLYANFFQRTPTTGTLGAVAPNGVPFGGVRPIFSETLRTPAIVVTARTPLDWYRTNLFMEDKKFQIIGPGIDDVYGGYMAQELAPFGLPERLAAYFTFPSGASYVPGTSPNASFITYRRLLFPMKDSMGTVLRGTPAYERSRGIADNSANCSERTFIITCSAP